MPSKPRSVPGGQQQHWARLGWILLLALVVRAVYAIQLRAQLPTYFSPEGGDAILFDRLASGASEPPRAYFHTPLYPWFLRAYYETFGRDLCLLRMLQHAVGVLTVGLSFRLTLDLFRRVDAAISAGLLAAVCGPLVVVEGQLLVDALMPSFVAVIGVALTSHARKPTRTSALLLGVTLGVAALGRAVVLLWVAPLVIWTYARRESGTSGRSGAGMLLLGVTLLIAPVTLRNYLVEQDFVLITANAGLNFYIGNNSAASGTYATPAGVVFTPGDPEGDYRGERIARRALGHSPSSSELSRWWTLRALQFLRDRPQRALELALVKARLLVSDVEIAQLYDYYVYREVCPVLCWLPGAGLVVSLALLGLARTLWRGPRLAQLWAALILTLAATFLAFFVVDRYRTALLVGLLPFAGSTCSALLDQVPMRDLRKCASLVAGLALGVLVSFGIGVRPNPRTWQHLAFGDARASQKRPRDALHWYALAIADDPEAPEPHQKLGSLLSELGEFSRGRRELLRAAALAPTSADTQYHLGVLAMRSGDPEEAARRFRRASRLNPGLDRKSQAGTR